MRYRGILAGVITATVTATAIPVFTAPAAQASILINATLASSTNYLEPGQGATITLTARNTGTVDGSRAYIVRAENGLSFAGSIPRQCNLNVSSGTWTCTLSVKRLSSTTLTFRVAVPSNYRQDNWARVAASGAGEVSITINSAKARADDARKAKEAELADALYRKGYVIDGPTVSVPPKAIVYYAKLPMVLDSANLAHLKTTSQINDIVKNCRTTNPTVDDPDRAFFQVTYTIDAVSYTAWLPAKSWDALAKWKGWDATNVAKLTGLVMKYTGGAATLVSSGYSAGKGQWCASAISAASAGLQFATPIGLLAYAGIEATFADLDRKGDAFKAAWADSVRKNTCLRAEMNFANSSVAAGVPMPLSASYSTWNESRIGDATIKCSRGKPEGYVS